MRNKSASTSTSIKAPEPPVPPKMRSLADVKKGYNVIPYLIEGDPEKDILDDDNFVVALAPLKFRAYANYETMYGESIDTTVSKILFVFSKVFQAFAEVRKEAEEALKNAKKKKLPEIELDADGNPVTDEKNKEKDGIAKDDFGRIITPYGPLSGSLQRNVGELCAFILSQKGQIVGKHPDGTYDYEEVSIDDIAERLDPTMLMDVVEEKSGKSIFFEILEVSGLWHPEVVADNMADNKEIEDDELKN